MLVEITQLQYQQVNVNFIYLFATFVSIMYIRGIEGHRYRLSTFYICIYIYIYIYVYIRDRTTKSRRSFPFWGQICFLSIFKPLAPSGFKQ